MTVGKERMYASPRIFTVSYMCVCVCVIRNTNAHICTFKLIKTKQNKMKTKAVLQLPNFPIVFCIL